MLANIATTGDSALLRHDIPRGDRTQDQAALQSAPEDVAVLVLELLLLEVRAGNRLHAVRRELRIVHLRVRQMFIQESPPHIRARGTCGGCIRMRKAHAHDRSIRVAQLPVDGCCFCRIGDLGHPPLLFCASPCHLDLHHGGSTQLWEELGIDSIHILQGSEW